MANTSVLPAAGRQGVQLGRPPDIDPKLARRIRAMRGRGRTLQAICDKLNAEGVPTPRGGTIWRPTSLRSVLATRSSGNG
jgi:hypothetical protein